MEQPRTTELNEMLQKKTGSINEFSFSFGFLQPLKLVWLFIDLIIIISIV